LISQFLDGRLSNIDFGLEDKTNFDFEEINALNDITEKEISSLTLKSTLSTIEIALEN